MKAKKLRTYQKGQDFQTVKYVSFPYDTYLLITQYPFQYYNIRVYKRKKLFALPLIICYTIYTYRKRVHINHEEIYIKREYEFYISLQEYIIPNEP